MGDIKTTFSADGSSLSQTVKNICAQFNTFKVQIGIANSALDGLGKAFTAVQNTIGQFTGVLELGGTLNDLSAQTGQSVKDLVLLRQAFQNTGLSADAVGTFAARLQKSLSGVNEEGQSTATAFRMLGTSVSQLRGLSLIEQLETLTKGFAGIGNESDRTAASMAIFGKTGARALSMFADTSAISQARKEVGGMAEVMDKSANSFDTVSDQLKTVSQKTQEIAAGIMAGVAPELESITKSLAETDLTGFGRSIGDAAAAVISIAEPIGKMKDQILFAVAAFVALRIGARLTSTDLVKSLEAANFSKFSSSIGQATAAIVGNFAAAGGGIQGVAAIGGLAFSSLGAAAKSCGLAIKSAFLSNPIGIILLAVTEAVSLFTKWHSAIMETGRAINSISDSTLSNLNTDAKKRANVTDTVQQQELATEVGGQIADFQKKLSTLDEDYKDLSDSERQEISDSIQRSVGWLEKELERVKSITGAQMEQNAIRLQGEEAAAAAARRARELRSQLPKLERDLDDARLKAATDGNSLDEKRAKILESVKADSLEAVSKEIDAMKGKADLTDKQVMRESSLIQAETQLLDLKEKEPAMKGAIDEAENRIVATKAEISALEAQSESAQIALKAEQEYAKAAIDYTKELQELKSKGVGANKAEELASKQRAATEMKILAEQAKANKDLHDSQSWSTYQTTAGMQGWGEIAQLQQQQWQAQQKLNDPKISAQTRADLEAELQDTQALLNLANQKFTIDTSLADLEHQQSQHDTEQIAAAEKLKEVEDSVFSTEEEKAQARISSIELENSHLESQIDLLKERLLLLDSDPSRQGEADQTRNQIAQIEATISANKRLSSELQTQQTYAGQLRLQFTQMFDQTALSAKNLATSLANSWSSAVDDISKGLTDVIFRAKTLGEAFQDIAKTIATDVVSSFIKMAIQYAAQKAFMFAVDLGFSGKRVAVAESEGAATAAAYAPAAATASVATFGTSAISGFAMAAIALAGIVALVAGLKGFNEGGLIPGSPSSSDNRIARVATGEYVVNSGAVSHYGAAIFEALNNKALPRWSLNDLPIPSPSSAPAFAVGGLVGPSDSGNTATSKQEVGVHVAVVNTRQDMRDFMQKEGKKHVVDIVRGTSWQLGLS